MIENKDEYFMRQALREAQAAYDADEVPVGAIIVLDNKIIARGHNQVELLNDSTAHAEILALTTAYQALSTKYLPEATLYVTIEPCLMCCGAMYWGKLKRIVYGASDDKNGYRHFITAAAGHPLTTGQEVSPFHPKAEIVRGVLEAECAMLMKTFFRARR